MIWVEARRRPRVTVGCSDEGVCGYVSRKEVTVNETLTIRPPALRLVCR